MLARLGPKIARAFVMSALVTGQSFKRVKMYQTLEISPRGRWNHAHQAASSNSLLTLPSGIAVVGVVVTDSSDRCLVGQEKCQVCIIHKDVGSFRIVLKVEGMKTFRSMLELHNPLAVWT